MIVCGQVYGIGDVLEIEEGPMGGGDDGIKIQEMRQAAKVKAAAAAEQALLAKKGKGSEKRALPSFLRVGKETHKEAAEEEDEPSEPQEKRLRTEDEEAVDQGQQASQPSAGLGGLTGYASDSSDEEEAAEEQEEDEP
ncbi:unnamed protein product [Polarella glacialis]|uniref:Uncharacterized protein n=1 Tax=Polarella glacialis TaxID=89957 RepID=A0A813HKB8_POLGL|nr:unnamed protein product [Polarella glacialis]